MQVFRFGGRGCFQWRSLVQRALSTSSPHRAYDPKRISLPSGGAGNLTLDIYSPREPSVKPRIVLYIPAAHFLQGEKGDSSNLNGASRIASRIRDAANAAVVQVNYRLGRAQGSAQNSSKTDADRQGNKGNKEKMIIYAHPTPLHDVATALDWVAANLASVSPNDAHGSITQLALYGELNGGSMALALAMTECRKEDALQVGAVATLNAVVDWVSISDQSTGPYLTSMKNKMFHPSATHPASPFDPFISPIHFLRTPVSQVPLTAAQKAAKEAEELGEAFKDVATLDDVLAQEAWIEDDDSTLSSDHETNGEAQTSGSTDTLAEEFAALQMLDERTQFASHQSGDMHDEPKIEMWDEREVDEDYISATTQMVLADAMQKDVLARTSPTDSQEQSKHNGKKPRTRGDGKGKTSNSSASPDKVMMRHRKWPPMTEYLNIPQFRLCTSTGPTSRYKLNGVETMKIRAQNQEMAKLLRSAIARENMAGIKDLFLDEDNYQLYPRDDSKILKKKCTGSMENKEMGTPIRLAQEQVQLVQQDDGDEGRPELERPSTKDLEADVQWFEEAIWLK